MPVYINLKIQHSKLSPCLVESGLKTSNKARESSFLALTEMWRSMAILFFFGYGKNNPINTNLKFDAGFVQDGVGCHIFSCIIAVMRVVTYFMKAGIVGLNFPIFRNCTRKTIWEFYLLC